MWLFFLCFCFLGTSALLLLVLIDLKLNQHDNVSDEGTHHSTEANGKHQRFCMCHDAPYLCQEVFVFEGSEVVCCVRSTTERLTVVHLMDISKSTRNTLVSVGVERIEVQ